MNIVRATWHAVSRAVLPAAVLAVAAAMPASAWANPSLVADMGCLNCHGAQPRGDAASFKRMQDRAASRGGDGSGAIQHWTEEMRASSTGWRAIVEHRQLSDESARAVFEWLARPPAKPVN